MRKNIISKKTILLAILTLFPALAIAADSGIGTVASNLLTPVEIVSSFMSSASLALGISALFASFVKYMQHRVNPLAHPIGTVFLLLVIGIILVCLPMIYKLTESGIPFSIH